jgi:hypothetical protein
MDWTTIIVAFVANGVLLGIVTGLQNRRINRASANNSDAEYSSKIIQQSDERVRQALDDRDRVMRERNDAYEESKGQRKAKQEWREKFHDEQKTHHETQLLLKDTENKLSEAEWHRCEMNGCTRRIPPRKRENT